MQRKRNLIRLAVAGLVAGVLVPSVLFAQQAADVASVVQGNNQFAFDMYDRLRTSDAVAANDGNLIFSPYSISTALGMVYAGARGQTAQEIANVFHFELPQERLHAAYGALIQDLNGAHRDGYELSVANRLWGQQGFTVEQPFLNTTRNHYGAELGRVDFVHDTENSRQTINQWVEDQTNQRIKDLIPQGAVTPDTRLVLTNAIYFLGDWKSPFAANATMDRPFAVNATEQIRAPTMYQQGHFRYADGGDFHLLELPYKGDQLSMLVVLPKSGGRAADPSGGVGNVGGGAGLVLDTPISEVSQIPGVIGPVTLPGSRGGPIVIPSPYEPIPAGGFAPGPVGLDALAAIEAALDPQSLQAAIDQLAYRDVNVYLPKFRLDTSAMLGTTLGDMGMPTAFTGAADFSGIADADLQISGVVHKAFIEVDEEGTEAAAATGVIIGVTSAYHPGMPLVFNADHPFEFLIRDNLTGSTLFMGRVARPDGEITAVPEPAGMVLAVAGCMWLVVMRVRRRKETARC